MATTFKIEGLKELKDALLELPKATGTNVQKRALMKAADPLQSLAQSLAPVLTGALQRSFTTGVKLSDKAKADHKKTSKVEVYSGPGELVQARLSEFGTRFQSPRPFMRPAWDATKV